jgi:ligand-binding sensor domain-containing protein/serine phosphatase RsbU (regulator of sigma subunit)
MAFLVLLWASLLHVPAVQGDSDRTVEAGGGRSVKAGPGLRQGVWQTFDASDGLPVPSVAAMVQDREGNLWFASWNGVTRYDGEQFVTFTTEHADNFVQCILEDREGNLWFGTQGGVRRYDPHASAGERFVTFTTEHGLADNFVQCILEDREGNLWFGTAGGWPGTHGRGVSRYDPRASARAYPSDEAYRSDRGEFVTLTTEDGLADSTVLAMLEDREGILWFGTEHGVSRYDPRASVRERFVTFTVDDGLAHNVVRSILEDREGNLWFGTEHGVSRYDPRASVRERFVTFTVDDGLAHNVVRSILEDREGNLWFGTWGGGVSRFDPLAGSGGTGEPFETFTVDDGLGSNWVACMLEDQEGDLWIGCHWGGGLSRYAGRQFMAFTVDDGLADNRVSSILEDREGHLWFGTHGRGVSRYDPSARSGGTGEGFVTFTVDDGLASNEVRSMLEDREGVLWFGTPGGVSRYDPRASAEEQFAIFTIEDGLGHNTVDSILEDREGVLWFGTYGGVSRYDARRPDGEPFATFTVDDGLGSNLVACMLEDREGNLWFGTWGGGVSRYDPLAGSGGTPSADTEGTGEQFMTFTTEHGLADNFVPCILEDREGNLWFGARRGVSRYDPHRPPGEQFVTFTTRDGLAANVVQSIMGDQEGHLWFGTLGGVSRFDGLVFQNLTKRDGLTSNRVYRVLQDKNGDIWIASAEGAIRYRPGRTTPHIRLTDVAADRSYGPVETLRLSTVQEYLTFEFQGRSLRTPRDRMVCVYRLEGYDAHWRSTRERRVAYSGLPRGNYVFQVKAVDRDLNYSEPVEVEVTVHLPYGRIVVFGLLGMAILVGAVASGYAVKRRQERDRAQQERDRAQQQLIEAMERELQEAHDVQVGLLPKADPDIPDFEIAGRSIPANHVGGDHYTYLWMDEEKTKLSLVIADVSGHEMKAAMTVMRFSEMLHFQIQGRPSPGEILSGLNQLTCGRLEQRMYVTACVGVLDASARRIAVSNAGHPPVYHRSGRTGDVEPLEVYGYALGMRRDAQYEGMQVSLGEGDVLVFYTDGVYEARDEEGREYGFDRLEEVIRDLDSRMRAGEMLDRIFSDVDQFAGFSEQEDDRTVVVVKVTKG